MPEELTTQELAERLTALSIATADRHSAGILDAAAQRLTELDAGVASCRCTRRKYQTAPAPRRQMSLAAAVPARRQSRGQCIPAVTKSRSLEKERPTWRVPDSKFPEREAMMQKYGWHGISAGIRLQPTHHAETVIQFDRLDQNYLKLWLDFIYAGMYVRGILDDKTRLLCMVGVCAVLDEQIQGENHQRAALMLGASPREVLEVLWHSTIYAGMPRSLRAVRQFDRILNELGRAKEAYDTQLPLVL